MSGLVTKIAIGLIQSARRELESLVPAPAPQSVQAFTADVTQGVQHVSTKDVTERLRLIRLRLEAVLDATS